MNKYLYRTAFVLIINLLLESSLSSAVASNTYTVNLLRACGNRLLEEAGKTGPVSRELPELYWKASVNKQDEFMLYVYAVIYVESRFNKMAVSPVGARGLMQMTDIAVAEATRQCAGLRNAKPNLHDSYTNVKYGTCYLKYAYEFTGNWRAALIMYNGGFQQLNKYKKGMPITAETSNYVIQVERARDICLGKE